QQTDQLDRHMRVGAFERNLVDRRARERRERLLVLAPLAAERLFPIDVRLDAVAVADVHGGRAAQTLRGTLERGDAPVAHLVEVDVEGRLIELNDVDARALDRARFVVQYLGECKREL